MLTHAGNGLGLFLKEVLPDTSIIGYFEWFFRPETTQHLVADFNLDERLKSNLRNLTILQELESCDFGVVPTEWQKLQFPKTYHDKLRVIFDGIDKNFFHNNNDEQIKDRQSLRIKNRETGETFNIPKKAKIISYATRGMETLRGFPEFMRALPTLLNEDNDLYAVIAGSDRRAYSFDAPSHGGSWKELLLDELKNKLPNQRMIFTGLLTYNDYRSLLWRSNLHCYFTRPYVTSWSLFEAAACGAHLAVNNNPATTGIADSSTISWVTLENQEELTQQLKQALKEPGKRANLLPGFGLKTSLEQWEQILNLAIQSK